jgi:hypothetical protein
MSKSRKKGNGESSHVVRDSSTADSGLDRVAVRAYELYLARGAEDGRAMDDWLTAEQELKNRSRERSAVR